MKIEEVVRPKKKILILTNDAGFGHRSTALAIQAALKSAHRGECDVEIINPLDHEKTPTILKDSQTDYDKWMRKAPELYKFGFETSGMLLPEMILEQGLMLGMFEVMRSIIRRYSPDLIVNTHPLYQPATFAVLGVYKTYIPVVTVVTDLITIHRLWFNGKVEALIVPTAEAKELAIGYGIPEKNIYELGIPVNPSINSESKAKAEIRRSLGWDESLPTVLVSGSKRVEGLQDAVNVLNHFGLPLQLAIVCGCDTELYQELGQQEWHQKVHLYEFSSEMDKMMKASDLMVSKAGGLSVTEALACGLPMVMMNVLPGQEVGNMEFVVKNGAGIYIEDKDEFLEGIAHLMTNDAALLKTMAARAAALGKPEAAEKAAEIIWEVAQLKVSGKTLAQDPNILNLLRLNQIDWKDYGKAETGANGDLAAKLA